MDLEKLLSGSRPDEVQERKHRQVGVVAVNVAIGALGTGSAWRLALGILAARMRGAALESCNRYLWLSCIPSSSMLPVTTYSLASRLLCDVCYGASVWLAAGESTSERCWDGSI